MQRSLVCKSHLVMSNDIIVEGGLPHKPLQCLKKSPSIISCAERFFLSLQQFCSDTFQRSPECHRLLVMLLLWSCQHYWHNAFLSQALQLSRKNARKHVQFANLTRNVCQNRIWHVFQKHTSRYELKMLWSQI